MFINTKKSDVLISRTITRPPETIAFRITKTSEPLSFDIPLKLEDEWMLELINLGKKLCYQFKEE